MNDTTGGYIDYNKLSQEDAVQYGICFNCHKTIESNIMLKKPITLGERMLMGISDKGDIWICKECEKKWNYLAKYLVKPPNVIL